MNLQCLIVDDEPNAVKLLEDYVQRMPFLQWAKSCYDGLEALQYLKSHTVDLIFLDINMPQLSGMDLLNILPAGQKVIFTTAYSEFAVQSYEKNAVDYLLKPISFARFSQAVMKAVDGSRIAENQPDFTSKGPGEYTFVKSGKKMVRVFYDDILYVRGEKEYAVFVTTSGEVWAYKRLKELQTALPEGFCRIHHSHIVNIHKIEKIEDNHVYIHKARLPVSQTYRENFFRQVNEQSL